MARQDSESIEISPTKKSNGNDAADDDDEEKQQRQNYQTVMIMNRNNLT